MMNLQMEVAAGKAFNSASRRAGVISEAWAAKHLYCVTCLSPSLLPSPTNAKAVDFVCPICQSAYQLKCRSRWSESRVAGAGYAPMMERISANTAPHLVIMHYTPQWVVQRLLVVPGFFFTKSTIHERPPLSPTARRAGWIGCDILLSQIALDGRIELVVGGESVPASEVRQRYDHLRLLQTQLGGKDSASRGWTLDVLACVRRLAKTEFTLNDVYEYAPHLADLHPNNNTIHDKIRQQLQILRDTGLLEFVERGRYRLR